MKLRFLGTRGEIKRQTPRHRRHSALGVAYRGREVLVDCGADWLHELGRLQPRAIVLTHAHLDHAGGLRRGAPCPVWATEETWRALRRAKIAERRLVEPRRPLEIRGIAFEAFPVEHSLRAPAVGFRMTGGRTGIFYAPDVAAISQPEDALAGVALYVGDGASVTRPIVRRRDGVRIGHASIREQLDWCAEAGVPRAVFTHCGSQILRDEEQAAARVAALARERGIEAGIAFDGLQLTVRS